VALPPSGFQSSGFWLWSSFLVSLNGRTYDKMPPRLAQPIPTRAERVAITALLEPLFRGERGETLLLGPSFGLDNDLGDSFSDAGKVQKVSICLVI
jgi:hypothetical protein